MLKNHLILALRSIIKNKVFSFINIVGLAIALASTFYILVYAINEFSYDDCHLKNERIYKVVNHKLAFNIKRASSPYIFAPLVKERLSEIERITRTRHLRSVKIKHNGELVEQSKFLTAENDIFEIFTLPIVMGTNDISDKNSIVISESVANKYFGDENPIGKTLEAEARKVKYLFMVVGVMKDVPKNSTLRAQIIGNIGLYLDDLKMLMPRRELETDWLADFWITYILLKETKHKVTVENGIKQIVSEYYPKDTNSESSYLLQNLKNVYFDKELIAELHGNIDDVYLYIAIGLIIFLFAASNYTILSSAISSSRVKEIGIRKTVGASKKNLVFQFLGESIVITFCALILSLLLIELSNTSAQELFNYDFALLKSNYQSYILTFIIAAILIGIISGVYVSVYLSSLNITEILKNDLIIKSKGRLRKLLILIQFISFIMLVFSSIVIFRQHKFFLNKDLGFDSENLIHIYTDFHLSPWVNGYIDEISSHSNIINVTSSMHQIPTNGGATGLLKRFDDPTKYVPVEMVSAGKNFIDTYGIKLLEGRDISKKFITKNQYKIPEDVIFNEAAIKALGIKDPIGKKVELMTIVGVFNNFNLHSLHSEIPPFGIRFSDSKYFNTITLRYKIGKYKETLEFLKAKWNKFSDESPFEYETSKEIINELYENEETLFNIVSFFTILAILLAASGLFGLTLFTLKKRTKEFGVRRVLGASTLDIFYSVSKEFLILLNVAIIIALPISFFLMNKWLENFAYKISIGIVPALVTTFAVIFIVIGAISFQTFKAALANPVESLRDE